MIFTLSDKSKRMTYENWPSASQATVHACGLYRGQFNLGAFAHASKSLICKWKMLTQEGSILTGGLALITS